MLELFSRGWSKAQEAAGQVVLVPKEWREETKGSLTTEGPEAAEEEASLSGPRWLLPEEEEGIPPIAILRLWRRSRHEYDPTEGEVTNMEGNERAAGA